MCRPPYLIYGNTRRVPTTLQTHILVWKTSHTRNGISSEKLSNPENPGSDNTHRLTRTKQIKKMLEFSLVGGVSNPDFSCWVSEIGVGNPTNAIRGMPNED